METISLSSLFNKISRVVALNFPEPIWITGEVLQIKMVKNHYYLELAEKGELKDIIAQASAVIWKAKVAEIEAHIQTDLLQILKPGNETRMKVLVDFHSKFGLKLVVLDVDERYYLGKIQQRKNEIIRQLIQEGVWQKNKELALPLVIQRIAIVSSPSASGYIDFLTHMNQNKYGYSFRFNLFQSSMQGISTETDVINAIGQINNRLEDFDCIVIIRGGGSKSDLHDFDNFAIAGAISHSQLPVFSGIGHHQDESIVDQNCHSSFKTPTAVAEHLLDHNFQFERMMLKYFEQLTANIGQKTIYHKSRIEQYELKLKAHLAQIVSLEYMRINKIGIQLISTYKKYLIDLTKEIHSLEMQLQQNDLGLILSNGFTMVSQNNVRVTQIKNLNKNEKLNIHWADGTVELNSKITNEI
ncbi:MAG: exodeoxyribonuclease VII large subunit [Saprospiraceae bacterium]|nr:exodeoxyribonuclease VII large subunit [Saprospiraceae bacterium]